MDFTGCFSKRTKIRDYKICCMVQQMNLNFLIQSNDLIISKMICKFVSYNIFF
jgi:hypothetical protein